MTRSTAPFVHAFTALVAVSALVVAWRGRTAEPPAGPPGTASTAALERQLGELQRRVADLAARPAPESAATAKPQRTAAVDDAVMRRLERLEERLGDPAAPQDASLGAGGAITLDGLEQMMEQLRERQREREVARRAEQRTESTAVFVDATKSEEDRLRALRFLRGAGRGARGGAVAQAAIALVQTSRDAVTRADVWRQMSGADEPVLVPHLLASLQLDPAENVREEAAETLEDYRSVPGVEAALRAAMEQDQSESVRRQAQRSLGSGR